MKRPRARHVPTLALALLAAGGCDAGGPARETATIDQTTETTSIDMVQGPSLSRVPPKRVPGLEQGGVRYEQVMDVADIDNRTGWLRATRIDTGEVPWTRQVYRHEIDPRMERDVQGSHFRSMAFDPAGNAILVENERGERFRVDPASGASSPTD